jgi:hypothetical protein
LALAHRLETEFPEAEPLFVLAACQELDQRWDR